MILGYHTSCVYARFFYIIFSEAVFMVYITGDTHGDLSRFETAAAKKLKKGDTLIVLGDFGFVWDGSAAEKAAKARKEKIYRRLSRRQT